ncbi:MAG: hypothetical protein COX80_02785 [Candidatus Magasanikbacteria bacterium CG_4_10_14_0_2_um_filter_33_14]|uniref:Uncharacterized protein n=1 Tax=Candidatus Magasanikbacteria bacterium CG_4_10_14_0_2_um_filter_33_14 TaxID=1974636 RepID=A0A2M7VAK4_9BACT|nr:MAG: hypothetical protein COX80_02785 [Candidatus Magasanikbacteria bacterium CG_4_10_14_0_2_um_filter_33_14]
MRGEQSPKVDPKVEKESKMPSKRHPDTRKTERPVQQVENNRKLTLKEKAQRFSDENAAQARKRISSGEGYKTVEPTGMSVTEQLKLARAQREVPPPIPEDSVDIQKSIENSKKKKEIEATFDMINKAGSPDDHTVSLRKPSEKVGDSNVNTSHVFSSNTNSEMPGSQRNFSGTKQEGLSEVEGNGQDRLAYLISEIRSNYDDLKIKINEDGSIPKGFFSRNIKKVEKFRAQGIDLDNKLKEIEQLRHSLGLDRGKGSQDKWSKAYEDVKNEDDSSVTEYNKTADVKQQQQVLAEARKKGYTIENAKGPKEFGRSKSSSEWSTDYDRVKGMSNSNVQAENAVDEITIETGVQKSIEKAGFDETSVNKKLAKKEKKGFWARLLGK